MVAAQLWSWFSEAENKIRRFIKKPFTVSWPLFGYDEKKSNKLITKLAGIDTTSEDLRDFDSGRDM